MPDDELEQRFRRWLLEEATGNQGATVTPTVAPTAAPGNVWGSAEWTTYDITPTTAPMAAPDVWRWPIRRNTDRAYWEDTDDCD